MPLFCYSLTCADETRTAELRKSNPQGWLLQAVEATYPEIASRRAADIMRLRLKKVGGQKPIWRTRLDDEPHDLHIQVEQT